MEQAIYFYLNLPSTLELQSSATFLLLAKFVKKLKNSFFNTFLGTFKNLSRSFYGTTNDAIYDHPQTFASG